MKRRQFLKLNTAGTLGILGGGSLWSCRQNVPLFRLSLAPWSLMCRPYGQDDPQGIDLYDYPHEGPL